MNQDLKSLLNRESMDSLIKDAYTDDDLLAYLDNLADLLKVAVLSIKMTKGGLQYDQETPRPTLN